MPETRSPLPQAVSENVLTLLCLSREHGRLVSGLVEPRDFENEVHRTIATRAIDYWREHGRAPGKAHIADLVSDILEDKDNRRATHFRGVINGMMLLDFHGINVEYVLTSVRSLQRVSELRRGTYEAAEILERQGHHGIGEVEKVWTGILNKRRVQLDGGLLRLTDFEKALKLLEARKDEFVTGIRPLDHSQVAPARGTTFLFLAPPGYGKTWLAVNVGRRAVQDRKKVLHITLELEADHVLVRYLQSFFAVPRDIGERLFHSMKIKLSDDKKSFAGLRRRKVRPAFGLTSPRAFKQIETKLDWYGRRVQNLIIQQFPMRRLDMMELAGYLDRLELAEKFVPDLVVLDYFGVVKTDPKDHRVSLGREFEEFRALMVERNMAGLTPQQINRKGMDARSVKVTHTSEDISLINTTDIAVTMSATAQEREKRLARLHVSKSRSGVDQFGALITQNYELGQFCVDAMRLEAAYWSWLDDPERNDDNGDDEEVSE